MGIFRPNKLNYTSDDVEEKSNSFIIRLVCEFKSNIENIVSEFKTNINKSVSDFENEINGAVLTQNNSISEIRGNVEELSGKIATEQTSREDKDSELDAKISNVVTTLNTEISQREGTNTIHDSKISELYVKKADKATTLSGYGISDAYTKKETTQVVDERISYPMGELAYAVDKKANSEDVYTKEELEKRFVKITENMVSHGQFEGVIGGIQTALDEIEKLQNAYIGGGSV
jgi:hypothetical protein